MHMNNRSMDDLGFGNDHAEYLTHHAQNFHAPDDFAKEVQEHLNNWTTPESEYEQEQRDEQNALQNVAAGGPAKIPAPPSPTPGLPLRP